jgi:lysozyme family protein
MSAEQFAAAWAKTGRAEAGYVNDPNDSGGETNHGITIAVARAHGYTGEMKDLSEGQAIAIAKQAYWDVMMLDDVADLSLSIASELFDTGFLSGTVMAGHLFQKALNLFRRADLPTPLFPELAEDGHIGKMTVYAFSLYLKNRSAQGELVMLRCLNSLQGAFFVDLCRAQPKDDKFVFGWFLNRVVI